MDILVIDATHGGVNLAVNFSKRPEYENIYLYDIYNTLKKNEINELHSCNVKIIELEDIFLKNKCIKIVYPVHLPLTQEKILDKMNLENVKVDFITHHEAVKLLLDEFNQKHSQILKIEITGVKGKTSSVFMLKDILIEYNPLILSSLGAIKYTNKKKIILQKDISITPANILETIKLAYRATNPVCEIASEKIEKTNNVNYNCLILESSLGVAAIGDVGLLTNITENYPIAKNLSDARTAKSQIFRCRNVAIKKETLDNFYPKEKINYKNKINSFSVDDKEANVYVTKINYNLYETEIEIEYNNLRTINGNLIDGNLSITTFAIGKHHVENVLGVVTTALTLEIPKDKIRNGLKKFKGIKGRSYLNKIENSTIIEEINPGINTKAIKFSIEMLKNPKEDYIIIGGDYGITCEEIDEDKLIALLESKEDLNIILTGALGRSINEKLKNKFTYTSELEEALKIAICEKRDVLLIYRSNYKNLKKR